MQAFEAVSFILLFFQVVSNTTYLGTYFQQRSGPENGTNVRFLKETVALSLLDCVRQCLEYPGCQVQGFHKIQNTCYLVGDESLANVVVNMSAEDTAWVFYENTLYATNESENQECENVNGWWHFNNSCYFVAMMAKDWSESVSFCSSEDSHLAVIRSLNEHAFVLNLLNTTLRTAFNNTALSTTFTWIGADYLSSQNSYQWTIGETWDFTKWDSGQPDDETENCVAMGPVADSSGQTTPSSGNWHDKDCFLQTVFVCEKELIG